MVYLVQRKETEPKMVMKEVQLRGLSRAEMIEAQNEVAVLKKVKHPHAIAIQDSLVVDDTLCIVMEYAEGGDLGALIARRRQEKRPFSEAEVLRIFWQLNSALAYCHHDLHMLHRDLKPQNIFLTAGGDVKLGDFGLAKIIEATCALVRTQCGTPVYMSPELCLGQDYNRGADVYALGCILYELMTLTMPWADIQYNAAGGMSALLRKIANSSLDLTLCKQRYSLELCNLLSSLLHKQSRNRPALNQVLQLDVVKRGAPKPKAAPSGGDNLPPSWRKVPSASRPGEFSYQHVPTGYKQSVPPEHDELPADVLAALAKATFSPAQRPIPTAIPQQPRGGATPAAAHTPRGAATPHGQGTPGSRQPPPQGTPGSRQQATPGAHQASPHAQASPRGGVPPGPTPPRSGAAPPPSGGAAALPPSWRKVPSASRPGEFSYLHMPTGYKQAEMPTTDAPPPAALAAWTKANGTNGRPPPTAGGAPQGNGRARLVQPGCGRLEPVKEQPSSKGQAPASRPLAPHDRGNRQSRPMEIS